MTATPPRIEQTPFGTTADGRPVDLFTLRNRGGLTASVTGWGGIVTALSVPDRRGVLEDVVLGHDRLAGYLAGNRAYLGAIVGRCANRIALGRFALEGRTYTLARNDGANHLHGGARGFDQALWDARPFEAAGAAGVELSLVSPDGDEGYPGALTAQVRYTLTDADALEIEYQARTDRTTLCNLTHHGYFNLRGGARGDVLDHVLQLHARRYTPVDAGLIPTGELAPVDGTPFDFTRPTPIGARIDLPHPQLQLARGYDHNFALDRPGPGLAPAARLVHPGSGRVLEVLTTEPGIQLYSGNFLDGSVVGKGGARYGFRAALCLETQRFPDAPNHPGFPSVALAPGEIYRSTTVYRFSVER